MDLEEQLLPHHFLKVHRSYLVNCRYIFHIGKTSLTLEDHTEIPISRGKVDFVKEQFLLYNIH
jgi:DNA-binding LytR/AlgR family response regulator